MSFNMQKYLSEGTRVRVAQSMDVPESSAWDDDDGRVSTRVKQMLQKRFFRGDPHLTAETVYVARESERERLRRKGLVKLLVRDQAGTYMVLTADPRKLVCCN
jgi:hypothetical protein